jgi:hypothetical protein
MKAASKAIKGLLAWLCLCPWVYGRAIERLETEELELRTLILNKFEC